ncbi:MAG: PadR family transcriptional regulator [Ardenticatenaceae bacterium]|nr:PadR family transcriptional regulator [Ardenticatenaceae bacterium]
MSLKHAILGFLSFKPLSGYDLKKAFDRSVSHFWPADQSQIYRTLKQLHKEGFITKQVIPREEQLDIKVYEITEAGREELRHWLATPLPLAETREPALIQLYFGFVLEDDQVRHLLQTAVAQIDQTLEELQAVYGEVTSQEVADGVKRPFFYSMLTLEYGIQANLWQRNWLQSIIERIDAGEMGVMPLADMVGSHEA